MRCRERCVRKIKRKKTRERNTSQIMSLMATINPRVIYIYIIAAILKATLEGTFSSDRDSNTKHIFILHMYYTV